MTVSGADSRKTRESARKQMRGTQPVSWRSKGNLRGFLYNWSRVSHFLLSVSRLGVWRMTCVRENISPNQTLVDLGEGCLVAPPPWSDNFTPERSIFAIFKDAPRVWTKRWTKVVMGGCNHPPPPFSKISRSAYTKHVYTKVDSKH